MNFQVEKWEQFVPDAMPLFPQHWQELALDQDKIKLSLNLEKYATAEKEGILFIATVRDEDRLVGYYTAGLLPHLHYASAGIMASTDMYFLLPEARRGGVGARFLMFIEDQLKQMGITKIYLSCKVHADHTDLFEALGYRKSDYMFTKLVG